MSKDNKRGFTTRLEVSPEADGKHWRLLRTFEYDVGYKGSGKTVIVPAGFVTDFASIPAPFWSFIGGSWGRYGKAAVIHDYLYQNQNHTTMRMKSGLGFFGDFIDRQRADDIFLEAMVVLNVVPWRRRLMYRAVRWFGWLAWRRR